MKEKNGVFLGLSVGALLGAVAVVSVQALRTPNADVEPDSATARYADQAQLDQALESGDLRQTLESLSAILDQEIEERQSLADNLHGLREDFQDLDRNLATRVQAAFEAEIPTEQDTMRHDPMADPGLNPEQRLLAAGFTRQELADIAKSDARERMRQVELDDRARREGWVNTPRYFQEQQAAAYTGSSARKVLGDAKYDRYLYTQRRPNRLMVQSVIETSPAEKAGFIPGDIVVAYAGQRVFTNQELVELRSAGTLGEPVQVDIMRDGQPMRISIPRGPMGITGGATVVDPDSVPGE